MLGGRGAPCCGCGGSVCCTGGCPRARGTVAGLDTDDELSCCRGFDGAAFAAAFTAVAARFAMAAFAIATAFAALPAAASATSMSASSSSDVAAKPDTTSASTCCSL